MLEDMDYPRELNTPTEQDEINKQVEINQNNPLDETTKTEETLIINEGVEDDYILSNSQNIKLNEKKVKDIVNSKKEEITPKEKNPIIKIVDHPKKAEINPKINITNPQTNKKSKRSTAWKEQKEKNVNDENTDELFKKAIENSTRLFPPIEHDNELSVRVTEVLYDKYVGRNPQKSKHLDIYSKFKDEAILQQREWTRTKDDEKKINDMIKRQEKYEEVKHDKKIGRQRELKNKIKKECVFIPNGKKNIQENMRTPSHFYLDQKKFVEKKVEYINKLAQDRIEGEEKNKKIISKNSEKIANNKNPNETLEQFCKRLAEEKLRNKKETLDNKKEEKKTMTKKEIETLTEKLHKEGETFKNNREKKEKEIFDKIKNSRIKKNFVLEKSTKVLFDKFVSEYDKVINDLFGNKSNKSDIEVKNKNYQIDFKEYKTLLNSLGFIKNDVIESEKKENEINKSFYDFLEPKEGKIDTNKFLVFCLAALGIYKGKDEKILEHYSKITPKPKPEEEQEKDKEKEEKNNEINMPKKQIRTSTEFIKAYLPELDMDKYGYTEKECNTIKSEFFVFILGISESWSKGLIKKKKERLEKLEETNKRINTEGNKKLENKTKKEEEFIEAFRRKLFNEEAPSQNDKDSKNNILVKTFKIEDMYDVLQKKKLRDINSLIAKKEEDINKECTFQPNYKNKPINKKEVKKNIEKLYLEGKKSFINKRKLESESLKENEKDCTFKPVIKDFNGNYFENNPLKEDKMFNTEIKKMEKLREEKGYTNKEIKKQMAFNIEPKSNKDNIDQRVKQNRGEKIVNNVKNEFVDYGNFDDKGNQITINIEVNLDNNKNEKLVILPGDDYVKVVDGFCLKYGINDDKKMRLIRAIKEKLRKNEN